MGASAITAMCERCAVRMSTDETLKAATQGNDSKQKLEVVRKTLEAQMAKLTTIRNTVPLNRATLAKQMQKVNELLLTESKLSTDYQERQAVTTSIGRAQDLKGKQKVYMAAAELQRRSGADPQSIEAVASRTELLRDNVFDSAAELATRSGELTAESAKQTLELSDIERQHADALAQTLGRGSGDEDLLTQVDRLLGSVEPMAATSDPLPSPSFTRADTAVAATVKPMLLQPLPPPTPRRVYPITVAAEPTTAPSTEASIAAASVRRFANLTA